MVNDPAVVAALIATALDICVGRAPASSVPALISAATPESNASPGSEWHIDDLVDLPPRAKRGSLQNRIREAIVRAAYHQLGVRRMIPSQRAKHDPRCRWCQVRVPWKCGAISEAPQSESRQPGEGPPIPSASPQ